MNYAQITTVFAVMIKCLILLHYFNTTREYRQSKNKSVFIVISGYVIYSVICAFGIPTLNIICGNIIDFFILYLGYKISKGSAIIQIIVLEVIGMFGELIASLIVNINLNNSFNSNITLTNDIIYTVISTIIFSSLIVILKNLTIRKHQEYNSSEMIAIIILPISTCAFLALFNQLHGTVNKPMEYFCIGISILLVISNLVVYVICERVIDKNIKIQQLQDAERRQELEDLYNKVCGIRHDLKNHFATIGALIDEEPQKAHEYIKSLTQNQLQSVIRFVKTDNDSFNAIANAKIAVCEREGIKVQTRIKNNSLSRLADDEIGIIFGNLFDNAIEAARQAEDKQINLDVTIKGEYLSIIMTNSVQGSVLADNKSLETTKKNKSLHGYGTKSINRIVKKYDGMINYFEENGLFGCQILI